MRALDLWRSWVNALTMKSAAPSRCVVHIGMRKTGSTSIQKSLAGEKARTHVYANLGPTNHSRALYTAIIGKSGLERLLASIRRAHGKTLILSGEGIPRFFSEAELHELKGLLDAHFERVQIVAYIREPAGYIASDFQERVKNGHADFDLGACAPHYRKWFEKFDNVFGREAVHLWKFDPARFPERNVVRDFCSHLDLEQPGQVLRENKTLSREALTLLYNLHRIGGRIPDRRTRRRLAEIAGQLEGTPFRLSSELLELVLEECKDETVWMERRLGEPLREERVQHPSAIRSEMDLLEAGGALGKEVAALKQWDISAFNAGNFDQLVDTVDRLKGSLALPAEERR
jgi:hypothetical protein